jgi:hypothetical protein
MREIRTSGVMGAGDRRDAPVSPLPYRSLRLILWRVSPDRSFCTE